MARDDRGGGERGFVVVLVPALRVCRLRRQSGRHDACLEFGKWCHLTRPDACHEANAA